MNRDDRRARRLAESQGNAKMIYNVLRTEKTPRDAAATLAAVHAALIWDVESDDEENARRIAQEMVGNIMILWKANKDAVDQQRRKVAH
jgi:hypothetical protein